MSVDDPKEFPLDLSDFTNSLGYATRISARIFERVLQWLMPDPNVQVGHWYFLRVLWQHEGLTQKQLSNAINLTESTTVIALNSMEERGMIERRRSSIDRRKSLIYLTDYGRSLEEPVMKVAKQINAAASRGLTDEELQEYFRLSHKIHKNLTDYFCDEISAKS